VPLQSVADLQVARRALDAPTLRLDGSQAAPNTIVRKRAVFHGALGCAVETALLPANPLSRVSRTTPHGDAAISPLTAASPEQARTIITEVAHSRPELTAKISYTEDLTRLTASGPSRWRWW
jgi:hypothetical protein